MTAYVLRLTAVAVYLGPFLHWHEERARAQKFETISDAVTAAQALDFKPDEYVIEAV